MQVADEATDAVSGHCLCGAVTIELRQLKPLIDACHCTMCRQWGGGPFMGVGGGEFKVQGREHIASYASSDWAERAFCNQCGSNLWYRFKPSDHFSFSAGLFELGDEVQIEQQIFVDEKPGYYDFAQQTPMKTSDEVIADAIAAGFSFES